MIEAGREWQARELAVAADKIQAVPGATRQQNAVRVAYGAGVGDVLRAIAGDVDPSTYPVLKEIFDLYADAI
jgi:hypothetical protein